MAGVTEINSIGGYAKEYQVAPVPRKADGPRPDPGRCGDRARSQQRQRRGPATSSARGAVPDSRAWPSQGVQDLGGIIVKQTEGAPIRIRDVADVGLGKELRTGAATDNGREVVLGTVFMLIGENSRTVSQAVDKQMAEINKTLPSGIHAVTVYDRTIPG